EVIGSEALQRRLHLSGDPETGVPAFVPSRTHLSVDLAGEHDLVAPAFQSAPGDLLRLPLRVDVRRIDEVDAGVKRRVDDADALVLVGVPPGAEHHRAEAEGADLDSGPTERSILHGALLARIESTAGIVQRRRAARSLT